MRIASIYVLKHPLTKEVRYVGKTIRPLPDRLRQHLNDKTVCHRTNWLKQLKGEALVPFIEQVAVVNEFEWGKAERVWIKHYKAIGCNLTNGTLGGDGSSGRRQSESSRQKIREAAIRQFSNPAARQAVSAVHKGKQISKKQRAAVAAANRLRWQQFREQKLSNKTI